MRAAHLLLAVALLAGLAGCGKGPQGRIAANIAKLPELLKK